MGQAGVGGYWVGGAMGQAGEAIRQKEVWGRLSGAMGQEWLRDRLGGAMEQAGGATGWKGLWVRPRVSGGQPWGRTEQRAPRALTAVAPGAGGGPGPGGALRDRAQPGRAAGTRRGRGSSRWIPAPPRPHDHAPS